MRTPGRHTRAQRLSARRPAADRAPGHRDPKAGVPVGQVACRAINIRDEPHDTVRLCHCHGLTRRNSRRFRGAWDGALRAPDRRVARGTPVGAPAVGALFVAGKSAGSRTHFCTASVVHSPQRDLVITAAHCMASYAASPEQVTFMPGYHDGKAPYGVWTTARVIVDKAWASASDPDDDVAFLIVSGPASGTRIEDVTGAEQLGIDQSTGVVRVIGYPTHRGGRSPARTRPPSSAPATAVRLRRLHQRHERWPVSHRCQPCDRKWPCCRRHRRI